MLGFLLLQTVLLIWKPFLFFYRKMVSAALTTDYKNSRKEMILPYPRGMSNPSEFGDLIQWNRYVDDFKQIGEDFAAHPQDFSALKLGEAFLQNKFPFGKIQG